VFSNVQLYGKAATGAAVAAVIAVNTTNDKTNIICFFIKKVLLQVFKRQK
jgi:hypothetical protein